MGIAGGHERQRLENRAHHHRIVFSKRLRGDQRAHVEESVRLPFAVAIHDGQVGSNRLARIERDGQREKQAARRGRQRGVRCGKELLDQLVQRPPGIVELVGDVHVNLSAVVIVVQHGDAFDKRRDARHGGGIGHRFVESRTCLKNAESGSIYLIGGRRTRRHGPY
jgi:hypothetical protein